jgi:two-component system, cell cycle sensor histidine kinase DivJ
MVTRAADSISADRHHEPAPQPSGALVWWHALWGLAVLAAGAALYAGYGAAPREVYYALACGIAPCLAALLVQSLPRGESRAILLVVWASFGAGACLLTGGVTGPLAPWILAPVAAAAVLGRSNLLAQAAALSLMAGCVAALAQLAGVTGPRPPQGMDFWLGLLGLSTTAVGLVAGLLVVRAQAARRDRSIRSDIDTMAALLAEQPHLIAVLSDDGHIAESFGRAPIGFGEEVLAGKPLMLAAQPSEQGRIVAAIAAAREHGSASAVFSPASAIDRRLAVDLRRAADGRLFAVIRDDTAAFSREARLEGAKADAENLAQGKSRFLANMSHELRTPLNAIMGFSDIMRAKMFGELPGRYLEYADLIYESGAHLLDLINDVLDMSKIEAQKYDLIREEFDSREPISGALRIVRLQADEAGVQLRGVLPAQPLTVNADRRAIKQIVLNLVSNALKFTPRGGSVTVALHGRGDDMELTVADTGVGIAAEDLEKIGRPYEQVGASDKKTMGTGLGLSLVRAFAELHGGAMTIESRLGAGTAVSIRLPVVIPTPPLELGGNVVAFNPQR